LLSAVSTAGSDGAGQKVSEGFCRGSVTQDTAWLVVELAGDEVEVDLVVGDVGALGRYSRSSRLVFSLVPRFQGIGAAAVVSSGRSVVAPTSTSWAAAS
jgi:hypothetical protein